MSLMCRYISLIRTQTIRLQNNFKTKSKTKKQIIIQPYIKQARLVKETSRQGIKKGFIYKLISEYKVLIFRVFKKRLLVNKKLLVRYIINYKALNKDIVKNKNLLSLILELKDRI